jgi:hypothetical protein
MPELGSSSTRPRCFGPDRHDEFVPASQLADPLRCAVKSWGRPLHPLVPGNALRGNQAREPQREGIGARHLAIGAERHTSMRERCERSIAQRP